MSQEWSSLTDSPGWSARSPRATTVPLRLLLRRSQLLLMGEVRGIRPLDGEALRDEQLVEEPTAVEDICQEATEPIAAVDVELEFHPLPVKVSLSEACGFTAEALS